MESLDCFQSSIELFVVALDEIRSFRATAVKELFCFDMSGQQIAVFEDMLKCCNLHRVIVMTRSTPANVTLKVCLTEEWKIEDLLFEIVHESPVGLFAADFERSPDVLEEMHMAELDDAAWVHIFGCHADGFVVIANEGQQFITGVLDLREELDECLVVLAESEHANRNVVREVIDAVDERNLAIVALHRHKLSIHDEEAAETFWIAVGECDLVVVRKSIEFCDNPMVGSIRAFSDPRCERPSACTFQVQRQERFRFATMINAETFSAIAAEMTFQTIS